jgi:hypothetical protein
MKHTLLREGGLPEGDGDFDGSSPPLFRPQFQGS